MQGFNFENFLLSCIRLFIWRFNLWTKLGVGLSLPLKGLDQHAAKCTGYSSDQLFQVLVPNELKVFLLQDPLPECTLSCELPVKMAIYLFVTRPSVISISWVCVWVRRVSSTLFILNSLSVAFMFRCLPFDCSKWRKWRIYFACCHP